jgi:hypothetical protein
MHTYPLSVLRRQMRDSRSPADLRHIERGTWHENAFVTRAEPPDRRGWLVADDHHLRRADRGRYARPGVARICRIERVAPAHSYALVSMIIRSR